MEASELRIGNWVSYKTLDSNDNWGVEYAQIKSYDISDMSFGSFIYEPIPLTEEWLLRFGSKKDSLAPYIDFGWLELRADENDCWLVEKEGVLLRSIQYVHQLQNLYFALTGEELTIKE